MPLLAGGAPLLAGGAPFLANRVLPLDSGSLIKIPKGFQGSNNVCDETVRAVYINSSDRIMYFVTGCFVC